MKTGQKSLTAILALLAAAALFSACGDSGTQNSTTDTANVDTAAAPESTAETEAVWPGEVQDLGGQEIRIFNIDEYWGMTVRLEPDESTGDRLNDALYERAAKIESLFNCDLIDDAYAANLGMSNMATGATKLLMAGDDTYDVMYIPNDKLVNLVDGGALWNLHDLDALNFDAAWWDASYNTDAVLGDALYGASGDGYLMAYDSSWCLFFNEAILTKLDMELPYQLVRDGKWTYDAFYSYIKGAASLNGDSDWSWTVGGNAVYGLVTHDHAPDKFILGAGVRYVTNENGSYVFSAETNRFYSAAASLAEMLGEEGTTLRGNMDDFNQDRGYVYTFMNSRAAFLTAELKTAMNMRDMEETFGIVPFPKYDETQENYQTSIMSEMLVMTIPTTSKTPETTAAVMDALYYEGMQSVVPVYFDVTVSQKGLRNEDSIDMLNIIRSTRAVDIATMYGWNGELLNKIRESSFKGNSTAASDVAQYKSKIEEKINSFVKELG